MIDGTIARKTKSVSEFGSRLDSVADIVFVVVCFVKILPLMQIPSWLWVWIFIVAIIRIGNIFFGFISKKQFFVLHTIMSKITGLLLFLFPLALSFVEVKYYSIVVCSISTVAAIQEGFYIAKDGKE